MTLFFGFVDGGEFENFELTLAVGGDDGSHIADLLADEAASDGRSGGDESLVNVGFLTCDELVLNLLVLGYVVNGHRRAEGGAVPGDIGEVDERQLSHTLFELAEARVDELLALFGHVVFGVFAQVAHGHGLLDLGGQFVSKLMFKLVDFFQKLLLNLFGHDSLSIDGCRISTAGFRLRPGLTASTHYSG